MYYFYQDTIITVRPGLGLNNYATCKLKKSGSWKTVVSPDMPRVERLDTAINNLHAWAGKKGLKKADCGCCMFCSVDGFCSEYRKKLQIACMDDLIIHAPVYRRCDECDMMERFKTGAA